MQPVAASLSSSLFLQVPPFDQTLAGITMTRLLELLPLVRLLTAPYRLLQQWSDDTTTYHHLSHELGTALIHNICPDHCAFCDCPVPLHSPETPLQA